MQTDINGAATAQPQQSNAILAYNFNNQALENLLNSRNPNNVALALQFISEANFESIPDDQPYFAGVTKGRVAELRARYETLLLNHDRIKDIQQHLGDISKEELAALMHWHNITGLNITDSHLIATINKKNAENGTLLYTGESRLQTCIRNGLIQKEMEGDANLEADRFFWNNFAAMLTTTPHPTKDKNADGKKLHMEKRDIMSNLPPEERLAALRANDMKMQKIRMTPDRKDTFADQTREALDEQDQIMLGEIEFLETEQDALNRLHGYGKINLMDADMHWDATSRRWSVGGDVDGSRIPASELFAGRVEEAWRAVGHYLRVLDGHDELSEQKAVFEEFHTKLRPIYENLQDVRDGGSHSEAFEAAIKNFSGVFSTTPYKGKTYANGPDLTRQMMKDLREKADRLLQDPSPDKQAQGFAARRAVLMHKKAGMGIGRQELRHNAGDLNMLFDNLFEYVRENGLAEIPPKIGKFSEITDPKAQATLLKRFLEANKDNIRTWLLEANNPDLARETKDVSLEDDRENRKWMMEIIKRFDVVGFAYNHERMGFAIIAEAEFISPVSQKITADASNVTSLTHCSLNEEEETIRDASKSLQLYKEVFGAQHLLKKIERAEIDGMTRPLAFAVMDPQSDSQKSYGGNIRWLQKETEIDLIKMAMSPILNRVKQENLSDDQKEKLENMLIAIYKKVGTGASPGRGGMHPANIVRLYLNSLQEVGHEMGFDLDTIPDQYKDVLKQMACFVSITIQGRDVSMRMGRPEEVADLMRDIKNECRFACSVIDGHYKGYTCDIVPEAPKYSREMKRRLEKRAQGARDEYKAMWEYVWQEDDENFGERAMNVHLDRISALILAERTNVGARPAARSKDGGTAKKVEAKPVYGLRAIGRDQALKFSGASLGTYTTGQFKRDLHNDYAAGEFGMRDVRNLKNDPYYTDHMMPTTLTEMAFSDYEAGFDRTVNGSGKQWTVRDLVEGKKKGWKNGNGRSLKQGERYQAELAYDAVLATSMMEALLDTPDAIVENAQGLDEFNPAAKGHEKPSCGWDLSEEEIIYKVYKPESRLNTLQFGPRTHEMYPHLKDAQEHKKKARLAEAAIHEMERRVRLANAEPDNPQVIDEKDDLLFHAACAARTLFQSNLAILTDNAGNMRKDHRPVYDQVLDLVPGLGMRVKQRQMEISNDNEPKAKIEVQHSQVG